MDAGSLSNVILPFLISMMAVSCLQENFIFISVCLIKPRICPCKVNFFKNCSASSFISITPVYAQVLVYLFSMEDGIPLTIARQFSGEMGFLRRFPEKYVESVRSLECCTDFGKCQKFFKYSLDEIL
jgi:hypothetical protein